MGKIMKSGKVVLVLSGRFAGRKAIIMKTFDEGTADKLFGQALVAGIDRYPRRVTRRMNKSKVHKNCRIKPFIKVSRVHLHWMSPNLPPFSSSTTITSCPHAIACQKWRSTANTASRTCEIPLSERRLASKCVHASRIVIRVARTSGSSPSCASKGKTALQRFFSSIRHYKPAFLMFFLLVEVKKWEKFYELIIKERLEVVGKNVEDLKSKNCVFFHSGSFSGIFGEF